MKHTINLISLLICGNIVLINCMPNPQNGDVSLDDVLAAAGNETARYGTDSGPVDQNALCSVFGGPNCQNNNGDTNENLDNNPEYDNADYYSDDPDIGSPGVKTDDKYDNCSYYIEEGFGYECVPYYNCKNGEIITDGDSLFDIRGNFGDEDLDGQTRSGANNFIKLDPLASKCPSYLEVCCRHPDYDEYDITVRPSTQRPITKAPPKVTTAAPVTPDPNNCFGASCPYRQRCGRHNQGGIGVRIQNLDKFAGSTQFGEWPHMCAILQLSQVGGREVNLYVGGASLIAPGILLTAAHVVNDIVDHSKVKVRCGEWDTQQQIEPQKHVDRFAKHISIHPGFDSKNLQNDFALIHLAEEFPLTQHINTMCLPDPFYADDEEFDDDENSYDTSDCFATGWGKDKFGSDGEYQVILKQVQLDIENHDQCENEFQKSRLGKNFQLDDSFLCAGGRQGQDTCKGDGGGPLVCPSKSNPGQYEQVGIVAWGLGCGEETPGVYADVTKALRFIDWATKCIDGTDKDYYGFGYGGRWAKHEYCEYTEKLNDYKKDVEEEKRKIPNAGSAAERKAIRKNIRGYNKEIKKMSKLLPLYENAILNCSRGKQDFDCTIYDYGYDEDDSEDYDLSGHARDVGAAKEGSGEAGSKVGPRIKIPE